jgi:AAA domain/Bifunctional DNA primase/polymerase, N-terminal
MLTPLATALDYLGRGWSPIPIPHKSKRPIGDEWQNRQITRANAGQWFNGEAQNIGVLLGEASGGLADADLDITEAGRTAPYFLPDTLCFGRPSKPRSHWLFQSDLWKTEDRAAIQFKFATGKGKDRKEQMILELRIGGGDKGAQTVFPGSVHETGELITWDDSRNKIAQADGADLKQCCARAASAALLACHFPTKGARHDAGLTLGGFLSRCGFSRPDTELFGEAVTIASGQPMEKVKDVRKAAREAWDEAQHGIARGFPALAETFGGDVAKHVAKWLGYEVANDAHAANGEAPQKRFELIPFDAISFDGAEEWRVKGLLPQQGVAAFFGAKSAFKSFAAQDLCFHIAAGWNWAGRRVEQCPVVYIAAEGSAGLRKRKAGFELYHGERLPWRVPFHMIAAAPNLGTDKGDLDALIAAIAGAGVFPGVITIDTVSQTLGSAEENGAGMIQLIANAQALSERFGCLVLLIHHAGLTETDRLRGHSSLGCALDALMYFERKEDALAATMTVQKLKEENDAGIAFDIELVRIVIGKDADGEEISTLVVETVRKAEAITAKAARPVPRAQRLLMTVIEQAIEEAGMNLRPLPDGPVVRCVKDSVPRFRYYAKIAEPADGEDKAKTAERKRKTWNRAIKSALDAKNIMAVMDGGDRLLWKP